MSVFSPHPPGRHPPPPIACCRAKPATIPTFSWLPENYGILHDASWCPKSRCCGGAVAVFCPDTLRFHIYPVNIPLRVDNAYTAELYTAWVALSARGLSADPTFTFRSSSWHFADCKGYITAQEGRREPDDSLQGDLLRACRALASGQPLPRHLYSHITGTRLDALLDRVDTASGLSAKGCPAPHTGIPDLLLTRRPPSPRRPPPCTSSPSRLPPHVLRIPPTATQPHPQRIRHRRQSWPPLMERPLGCHWPSPFLVPPPGHTLPPLPLARPW